MKSKFIISLIILSVTCIFYSCGSDDGPGTDPVDPPEEYNRQQESIEMKSTILSRTVRYSVLLPEEYDKTKNTYPVVYLLHGYGDNENSWLKGGNIRTYADRAVANGTSEPVILVMPQGNNTYYVNRYNGDYNYMDMITSELVPLIDEKYRTKKDKRYRAVMGYSMGGYGAFILPTLNPDIFSASVALSMSWRTDEQYMAEPQGVFDSQFGSIFGGVGQSGQGRITDYFKKMSPFHFFKASDVSKYSEVNYFLDCGDDEEQLSITNDRLHALMLDKNIRHEYRMRNGAHNWDYWSGSMNDAFAFMQASFDQSSLEEEDAEVSTNPDNLKGEYSEISINGLTEKGGLYLPQDYATSGLKYPVIYILHDRKTLDTRSSIRKVLSLVETGYIVAGLSKCIVVELPVKSIFSSDFFSQVVEHIDTNYRTLPQKSARIIMANNDGGRFVENTLPLVNGCFLYNAELPEAGISRDLPFYYLDMTDKFTGCEQYSNLYSSLRADGIEHQYRVRNGTDSYRSFLNGLSESFAYMNSYLDKPTQ